MNLIERNEKILFQFEQFIWWLVEKLMHLAWTLKDRRLNSYVRNRK